MDLATLPYIFMGFCLGIAFTFLPISVFPSMKKHQTQTINNKMPLPKKMKRGEEDTKDSSKKKGPESIPAPQSSPYTLYIPPEVTSCKTLADLHKLTTPLQVQQLLDSLAYNCDDLVRCPEAALRARKVHCLDGAILAAAALKAQGQRTLIVFLNAEDDDGHAITLFSNTKVHEHAIGAVAKSNFVGLRYREPIYTSLRELVMSYFDCYFNYSGKRTLRGYSDPLDISALCKKSPWESTQSMVAKIEQALYLQKEHRLLSEEQCGRLTGVDERCFRGGTLGIDLAGVYGVSKKPTES